MKPNNNFAKFINKNRSKILTAFGIGGLWGAAIWSNFQTVKITRLVDEEKKLRGVDKLPTKDIFKLGWKHYLGPVSVGIGSTGSVIVSDVDQERHVGALQAGLALAEAGKEKIIEETKKKIGEEATKAIEDKARQDLIEEKAAECTEATDIISTGCGEILYFEPYSGHFFRSSPTAIAMAFTSFCEELRTGNATLNEWLNLLNLDWIRIGFELGLDDTDLRNLRLDINTQSVPCLATGEAAMVVEIGADFHTNFVHLHG